MAQQQPEMPRRHSETGELVIHGPVDQVFQLFTPKGELDWIPNWKYSSIYPASGETEQGMVFRTDQGATTWLLARYDPPNTSIYALVNENFVGRIEVNCRAEGPNETRMRITFTFTMLTEKGEHHVAQQAGPAFQKKMDDWRVWLDEYAVKAGWMK